MWKRLERKISFLNCLFVYFIIIIIFLPSTFLFFFFLLFLLSAFFYPHFPIRIRHPQVSGPRFTDTPWIKPKAAVTKNMCTVQKMLVLIRSCNFDCDEWKLLILGLNFDGISHIRLWCFCFRRKLSVVMKIFSNLHTLLWFYTFSHFVRRRSPT